MGRHALVIILTREEQTELDRRVRARTGSPQAALRARIVLRAAEGASNTTIAAELGSARSTAPHWRTRFAVARWAGLNDRPHHPPPRRYGPEIPAKIVPLAGQKPSELGWDGPTPWSTGDLARSSGEHPERDWGRPSKRTVAKILQVHDLRLDRL
jgi:hypothetical protein